MPLISFIPSPTFGIIVVSHDDQDERHHNEKNQQIPKSI